jgi:hypothetical protein
MLIGWRAAESGLFAGALLVSYEFALHGVGETAIYVFVFTGEVSEDCIVVFLCRNYGHFAIGDGDNSDRALQLVRLRLSGMCVGRGLEVGASYAADRLGAVAADLR